jgi:hypothetical protein
MPLIPMKQVISVRRAQLDAEGNPVLDVYGNPVYDAPFDLPCRVDEGSQVIATQSEGTTSSKTAVAEARIMLDKLTEVRYTDELTFTNELGIAITRNPKQIDVKRGVGSKPLLTEVYV